VPLYDQIQDLLYVKLVSATYLYQNNTKIHCAPFFGYILWVMLQCRLHTSFKFVHTETDNIQQR